MDVVWTVLIGIVAGWLASQLMRARGFSLLGYLIVGVAGALVGGFAFGLLGFKTVNILGRLISATAGVMLLLFLFRYLRRGRRRR